MGPVSSRSLTESASRRPTPTTSLIGATHPLSRHQEEEEEALALVFPLWEATTTPLLLLRLRRCRRTMRGWGGVTPCWCLSSHTWESSTTISFTSFRTMWSPWPRAIPILPYLSLPMPLPPYRSLLWTSSLGIIRRRLTLKLKTLLLISSIMVWAHHLLRRRVQWRFLKNPPATAVKQSCLVSHFIPRKGCIQSMVPILQSAWKPTKLV